MGKQLRRAWKAFYADIIDHILTMGFIAVAVTLLCIGTENIEKIWLWATGEGMVEVLVWLAIVIAAITFFACRHRWRGR